MRAWVLFVAIVLLAGCAATPAPSAGAMPAGHESLRVRAVRELPHDPAAFTQGLELAGNRLYESTGLVGRSEVRYGPLGGAVEKSVPLESPLFGEGITVMGNTLWQLTWTSGIAIQRDANTLAELRRVNYPGEGWGLCHQGDGRLVMSDGSARLTFRDPNTFAETGSVEVHDEHGPRTQLNELECGGDQVLANVWQTDRILRIDPASGAVTGEIDASGLLPASQRQQADVLNGIAAIPGTDRYLLTGKLWPTMFEVTFDPPR